jgi:hypothetical protein
MNLSAKLFGEYDSKPCDISQIELAYQTISKGF